MCAHTRTYRIRNEEIREKVEVTLMEDETMKATLRWCEHVKRICIEASLRGGVRG